MQLLKKTLDFIYPRRCLLCLDKCPQPTQVANEVDMGIDLCPACEQELPLIQNSCRQCAIPLPAPDHEHDQPLCGQCQKKTPHYDRVTALYHYAAPIDWMIQQMKFRRKTTMARTLSRLMANYFQAHHEQRPEAIIPVPLHPRRQLERGFNQAEELARLVSAVTGCPVDSRLVERFHPSQTQSGLDAKQRQRNVKNIFRVKKKKLKSYQHVCLIDDVMSTGSTVNELSRLLKQHGVKRVDVWVLARAGREF